MRVHGPLLLLFSLCSVSSIPVEQLMGEFQSFDYSSLLNFNFIYTEELKPFVAFACASMDYMKVMSLAPDSHMRQQTDKLINSICSKLPESERIDMSGLEKCFQDLGCAETSKIEFLMGLTQQQDFFHYFNVSTLPVKQMVSECLGKEEGKENEGCASKNEARSLLSQWHSIIHKCEDEEAEKEKELLEALNNAAYNRNYSHMDPMMTSSEVGRVNPLDLVQAKCLKKSMSEDVKRAITRSLNATAVCSKEIQPEIVSFLSADDNYGETGEEGVNQGKKSSLPLDVVMDLSRKLMSCDNSTVTHMMNEMLSDQSTGNFKAGYAIWETIKMLTEEQNLLRKRRHNSHDGEQDRNSHEEMMGGETRVKSYEEMAHDRALAEKWDEGGHVWTYTYALPPDLYGNNAVLSFAAAVDLENSRQPITVRMSEVHDYPPYEYHLSMALEAEMLNKVYQFMSGHYQTPENIMTLLQTIMSEQWFLSPFKLSTVYTFREFQYSDEFMSVVMQVTEKFQQIIPQLTSSFPREAKVTLDKMGDTGAQFTFDYNFPSDTSVEVKAMAKTPAGDTLFKVSSEMGITANDLGEMGFKVTAEANMFNDQYKYGFKGHYEPMTEVKSVETTCEMTMKLTDEVNGNEVFSWSSCTRPVYFVDEETLLEPISNVYQVFEIPHIFKLNFTLDFGENGFAELMNSPKIMSVKIDLLESPFGEFGIQTQVDSERERSSNDVMMLMKTKFYVTIPALGRTMSLDINSDIFEDLSLINDYQIQTISSEFGQEVEKFYSGVMDLITCSEGSQDFINSAVMTQMGAASEDEVPVNFCYDMELELPNDQGFLAQHINYQTKSGAIDYMLDVDYSCEDYKYRETANFSINESGFWKLAGNMSEPSSFLYNITNYPFHEIPLQNSSGVELFLSTETGFFLKLNSSEHAVKPSVIAYSFLNEDYAMRSLANRTSNYVICSVYPTADYEHVLQCNSDSELGFSSITNLAYDYVNTTMKNEQCGVLKAFLNSTLVQLQMLNKNGTQFANMSMEYAGFELMSMVAFYKPMNSSNGTELCRVVDYDMVSQSKQMHTDEQCVQDMIRDPMWSKMDTEMLDTISTVEPEDAYEMTSEWFKQGQKSGSNLSMQEMMVMMANMRDMMMDTLESYLML